MGSRHGSALSWPNNTGGGNWLLIFGWISPFLGGSAFDQQVAITAIDSVRLSNWFDLQRVTISDGPWTLWTNDDEFLHIVALEQIACARSHASKQCKTMERTIQSLAGHPLEVNNCYLVEHRGNCMPSINIAMWCVSIKESGFWVCTIIMRWHGKSEPVDGYQDNLSEGEGQKRRVSHYFVFT